MKLALRLVLACIAPAVASCAMLPAAGPTAQELTKQAKTDNPLGFNIVDLTPAMATLVAAPAPTDTPLRPVAGMADKIGVDDVVQITVFEAGLGLFSSGLQSGTTTISGNATGTALPPMTVAADGTIAIPYVGRVHAAGVSAEDLREYIENSLSKRKFASQPQVTVSVVTNLSNTIVVSGDVKTPGRYPLTQAPLRLLDAVALAGSGLHLPYDTTATLTRQDREERINLGSVDALSALNVKLEAGDRVYVAYEPRTYTVFGATLKQSEISFDTQRVNLAQALARASGLDDDKADPGGVYLFRFETPEMAKQLGLDGKSPLEPVVYHINMKDPTTYFLIQQFQLRDHDVIYVADARGTQLRKFLSLLSAIFVPLGTAGSVANLVH